MTLLIPNAIDAAFPDQAEPDSRDFADILAIALNLTAVVSGCAVTAQGSPDMTVAVASGSVVVAGTLATVASGNVTITAANGTNPRFDLICVDSAGVKSAVAGTAAANPVFPDPAGKVVLAAVYVPASDTTINTNQITDKRVIVKPWVQTANERTRVKAAAEGFITENMTRRIPNSTQLMATQTMYGELVELVAGDVISNITVGVNTAGASLSLVKVGIYSGVTRVALSATNHANFTTSLVLRTTSLTSTYTVPTTGGYYLAILAVGTTPPTLNAANNSGAGFVSAVVGSGAIPVVTMASQADLPATATWAASAVKPIWMAAG